MSIVPTITEPVRATSRFWNTHELRVIRERYPVGGAEACADLLPDRDVYSIYRAASRLGVRVRHRTPPKRAWTTTPEIDAAIRGVYTQPGFGTGVVNALARRIGRPKWWTVRRARDLGLITPRVKEPEWSAAELELLEDHAHKNPRAIARILAKHGYRRSETAIAVKRKRVGVDLTDPDHYTATALAHAMGVDVKVVTSWIAKGWLTAKRRGTQRLPQQGGDHWWIHRRSVRAFLIENVAHWDHRKCDRYWLVDALSGRDIS